MTSTSYLVAALYVASSMLMPLDSEARRAHSHSKRPSSASIEYRLDTKEKCEQGLDQDQDVLCVPFLDMAVWSYDSNPRDRKLTRQEYVWGVFQRDEDCGDPFAFLAKQEQNRQCFDYSACSDLLKSLNLHAQQYDIDNNGYIDDDLNRDNWITREDEQRFYAGLQSHKPSSTSSKHPQHSKGRGHAVKKKKPEKRPVHPTTPTVRRLVPIRR